MIGKTLGHYRIEEKLGAGEMADMYCAKANGPELKYELVQSLGAGQFVDAYWEKSYLIPLPFTLDMARIESPSVVGEVIGWGKVVEQDDGWWASYYYPLRIAVVCTKCLIYERVLQPVKYIHARQYWEGKPDYAGYCSTHMLERAYSDPPFFPESHWLPAREVEARLMARYGVGRADLPVVEDDPGLFLAEMGIECGSE